MGKEAVINDLHSDQHVPGRLHSLHGGCEFLDHKARLLQDAEPDWLHVGLKTIGPASWRAPKGHMQQHHGRSTQSSEHPSGDRNTKPAGGRMNENCNHTTLVFFSNAPLITKILIRADVEVLRDSDEQSRHMQGMRHATCLQQSLEDHTGHQPQTNEFRTTQVRSQKPGYKGPWAIALQSLPPLWQLTTAQRYPVQQDA
jgi:hypothetical protein